MNMAVTLYPVSVGSTANDGTGDTLRGAMQKINASFSSVVTELTSVASLAGAIATTLVAGRVKPDGTTIQVTGEGLISVPTASGAALGLTRPDGTSVTIASGVLSVPTGTTTVLGLTRADGTTVTISGGTLSVPKATSSALGIVKGDGATLAIASDGTISASKATSAALGVVKPDGTTLSVDANGTLTATAAAATYSVVANQAARLALTQIANLRVVAQTDTSRIWYLNANQNPATAGNWVDGGSSAAGVNSFNTRTGIVTPTAGDYLAYIPAWQLAKAYSADEVVRKDGVPYVANAAVAANTAFAVGTTGATWRTLYQYGAQTWQQDRAYFKDDVAIAAGVCVIANADIAANTAFNWGTTGATWRPATYRNWMGPYKRATAYKSGDMFVYAAGLQSMPLVATADFTSGNSETYDSAQFWPDLYTPGGAGVGKTGAVLSSASLHPYREYLMVGATSSKSGAAGGIPGPAAGDQGKFFTGNGTWSEAFAYGDTKYSYQTADHGGWVLANGRAITTLTDTQKARAQALGWSANIPDERNRFPVAAGTSYAIGTTGGSSTIARANLPNDTLTFGAVNYTPQGTVTVNNFTGTMTALTYTPEDRTGNPDGALDGGGGGGLRTYWRGVRQGEYNIVNGTLHNHTATFTGTAATFNLPNVALNGGVTQTAYNPPYVAKNCFIFLGL